MSQPNLQNLNQKEMTILVERRSTIYSHNTSSCLRSLPGETEVSIETQLDQVPLTQDRLEKILHYLQEKGGEIKEDGTLYTPEPFCYEMEEILGLTPITAGFPPHSCLCPHENTEEIISIKLVEKSTP